MSVVIAMLKIRSATTEDKESIVRVYNLSTESESRLDEAYCELLIRQGSMVVAELDQQLVGFGAIDLAATEQLKWLYLLPEHQRTGLGSQILQQLEHTAWNAGLTSLRLHSFPGAVNFYLKLGYREVSRVDQIGHDHDGVEMIKDRGAIKR